MNPCFNCIAEFCDLCDYKPAPDSGLRIQELTKSQFRKAAKEIEDLYSAYQARVLGTEGKGHFFQDEWHMPIYKKYFDDIALIRKKYGVRHYNLR